METLTICWVEENTELYFYVSFVFYALFYFFLCFVFGILTHFGPRFYTINKARVRVCVRLFWPYVIIILDLDRQLWRCKRKSAKFLDASPTKSIRKKVKIQKKELTERKESLDWRKISARWVETYSTEDGWVSPW